MFRVFRGEFLLIAKFATILIFGIAISSASSCRDEGAPKLEFKHEVHAKLGIACADCHTKGGEIPTIETCKTCHAEALETVTPKDVEEILASRHPLPGSFGLTFSHPKHEGLDCATCHTATNGKMSRPAMATCLDACHGVKASYPLSCNSCHSQLDAKGQPVSHATGWKMRHGGVASAGSQDCKTCHTEETCFSCHRTSKPQNHNQHFRLRGHGVIAQADREKCLTCHKENYCSTCHLGTQPISHTSIWKGVNRWTHCNSCHLPLQNNNCATCHTSAQHKSAPAWPTNATHVSGADCRACHRGIGAGLNHPDNGDNCETCHAK